MPLVNFNNCSGYLSGTGKVGLIVIQEWWGLTDHLKGMADRLAKDGQLTALAPDLYHGKVAHEKLEAEHLMSSLDWKLAMKELAFAKQFLHDRGIQKVVVTGFCMGGALTLAALDHIQGWSAGICFYGIPDTFNPGNVSCPVQLHFGESDDLKGFSDLESATKLEASLKKAGKSTEFLTYKTGHAFMNETGPKYHKESAELAYKRLLAFVQKHTT